MTDNAGAQHSDSVLVTIYSNSQDSDGDGLPDGWEFTYFGGLQAGAAGDSDLDGGSNLVEFNAQTNPKVFNDADRDTVGDWNDNCRNVANTNQSDVDGDGIGDMCDSGGGCA